MDLFTVSILLILLWLTIYSTHHILSSCSLGPYIRFTQLIGLNVKPLHLNFYWTGIDNQFKSLIRYKQRWVHLWFNLGVFTTIFLIPFSTYLVTQTLLEFILPKNGSEETSSLRPYLPGINLPMSEIFYYLITLLASSVLHEFGHLLAALSEGIRVNGVGLTIFIVLPIAFVDISEDQMRKLPYAARLRIFCGGVWHNIVLAVVMMAILTANPFLLAPICSTGNGATIASVSKDWGGSPEYALQQSDTVNTLNRDCLVTNKESWRSCFVKMINSDTYGYCVTKSFIKLHEVKTKKGSCCPDDLSRFICFRDDLESSVHCLPAREVLDNSTKWCNSSIMCDERQTCIEPVPEKEGYRMVELGRLNKSSFLFWGHPMAIYSSLILVDYRPKLKILSPIIIYRFENLLRYLVSFSFGLAFLNSIPCYLMDGKWILQDLVRFILAKKISRTSIEFLVRLWSFSGTLMIALCVVLGFKDIFSKSSLGRAT